MGIGFTFRGSVLSGKLQSFQQLIQITAGAFVIFEVDGDNTAGARGINVFLVIVNEGTLGGIQMVGVAQQFIDGRFRLDQMYSAGKNTSVKKRKEGEVIFGAVKHMLGPVGQV